MLIDVSGTKLEIGDPVAQTEGWTLILVSGSSGSARVRGKNNQVHQVTNNTLEGVERRALNYAVTFGLLDSSFY